MSSNFVGRMDNEPKENSDLLAQNNKDSTKKEANGNLNRKDEPLNGPADGGIRAYSVVVASFLTNGLLFGVINSYSVIYTDLLDKLKVNNVENAEIKAALVGALSMGTTFFLSPLSGVLTGFLGIRMTAVLGGIIGAIGMLLSSFLTDHVDALCFTYGVMYGLGASLAYTPSLAILGHYFKKYLGLVNGVVCIGSSVFTIFMPPLMEHVIENYGLEWNLRMIALFTFGVTLCGLLFKPIPLMVIETKLKDESWKSLLKLFVNVRLWKFKKYRLWALSIPIALFGYFVPYVHIKKFIEQNFDVGQVNPNLPIQCIAITSGVGRILFGFLGDIPRFDKIYLQQISFYVIGILTIILPFARSFGLVVCLALGMGLFEGGFIALIGPIAIELCGGAYAAQAIGFMFGLAAIPLSVGPPIAGALFSHYNSYTLSFVLAGISPLLGSTIMFAIRLHRNGNATTETNSNGHISLSKKDVERNPEPLLAKETVENKHSEA